MTVAKHRRRTASARPGRRPVLEMTDARTRGTHLITDDEFAAGCRAGRYHALCGTEVLAASLTTPDHSYCKCCARSAVRTGG